MKTQELGISRSKLMRWNVSCLRHGLLTLLLIRKNKRSQKERRSLLLLSIPCLQSHTWVVILPLITPEAMMILTTQTNTKTSAKKTVPISSRVQLEEEAYQEVPQDKFLTRTLSQTCWRYQDFSAILCGYIWKNQAIKYKTIQPHTDNETQVPTLDLSSDVKFIP